jgi:hypothetical protein
LNESQVIIVYKRVKPDEVVRRIVRGPCIFMPHSNEWIHQFSWHKQDSDKIGHLIRDAHHFQILTIKSDFFHYYVKEVRTLDDTLITVKLMVIYELEDIFKMVN